MRNSSLELLWAEYALAVASLMFGPASLPAMRGRMQAYFCLNINAIFIRGLYSFMPPLSARQYNVRCTLLMEAVCSRGEGYEKGCPVRDAYSAIFRAV